MDINANSAQPANRLTHELRVAFHLNPGVSFNLGQVEEMYKENKGYMRECIRVMFSLALSKVQLQIIDLPNERLAEDGVLYLRLLMQYFTRLSYLRLMDNALGTTGLRHLVAGFRTASQIEVLDLSMNHLVDDSAAVLAEGLALIPHLQVLRLNNNEITDQGAAILAPALLPMLVLVNIDLSFNDIGDSGCSVLFQQMPNAIRRISIIANRISSGATPSIKMSLRRLTHLAELNLGGNRFTPGDRRALKTGKFESVVHFGVGKPMCEVM